jgi:hypothetical protein
VAGVLGVLWTLGIILGDSGDPVHTTWIIVVGCVVGSFGVAASRLDPKRDLR